LGIPLRGSFGGPLRVPIGNPRVILLGGSPGGIPGGAPLGGSRGRILSGDWQAGTGRQAGKDWQAGRQAGKQELAGRQAGRDWGDPWTGLPWGGSRGWDSLGGSPWGIPLVIRHLRIGWRCLRGWVRGGLVGSGRVWSVLVGSGEGVGEGRITEEE
jgi:hypothetical protein